MSPGSDILPINSAKIPTQVINNKDVLSDDIDSEVSFADALESAPADLAPDHDHAGGETLPPGGSDLPQRTGQLDRSDDDLSGLDVLPLEELAAFVTDSEPRTEAALAAHLPRTGASSQSDIDDLSRDLQRAAQHNNAGAAAIAGTVLSSEDAQLEGDQPLRPDAGLLVQALKRSSPRGNTAATNARDVNLEGLSIAEQYRPTATTGREFQSIEESLASLQRGVVVPGSGVTVAGESGSTLLQAGTPGSAAALGALVSAPQTQPASLSAPQPATALTTSIDLPVTDKAWGNAFNERVTWLSGQKIQNAEIRLSPAELGPIRVTISVQDDAAQLTFSAHHALTRDAIEQAMPRLREMLSENGLSLAESTVDDGQSSDVRSDEHDDGRESAASIDASVADGDEDASAPVLQRSSSALIDTFV